MNETFRFATADPRFRAFGAACLTGAPRGAAPPIDEHPLRGCTSTPVGPVPPGSASPFGYLQLTDASDDQIGAVLFDSPVPSRNGLQVTFEQWQYGNNPAVPPADGISFFLTDGAERLTRPGPFGGSLGYAQKLPDDNPPSPFLPGVDHGYLGIGLDVLGNYFGDWEHRGNGCPPGQRSPAGTIFRVPAPGPNMVTRAAQQVRGRRACPPAPPPRGRELVPSPVPRSPVPRPPALAESGSSQRGRLRMETAPPADSLRCHRGCGVTIIGRARSASFRGLRGR